MIKSLIRKRSFENVRFLSQYWLDATQLYTIKEKNDDKCLTRTFTKKETGEKITQYYHSVLEDGVHPTQTGHGVIAYEYMKLLKIL